MTNEFAKDIGMENETGAEAPASVTIRGYYKGYSVLVTNRDPSTDTFPLVQKAIKAIDWMIENGFKPSWADKLEVQERVEVKKADPNTCQHTNVKEAQSKTEKNPGRWFKSCSDCGKFLSWK